MSQIDKRIQVNTIIENQLPEFIGADFSKTTEFLKQYYISQEFQGGSTNVAENLDRYTKLQTFVGAAPVSYTHLTLPTSCCV